MTDCLCCNMPDYNADHEPTCPWLVASNALAADPSSPTLALVPIDVLRQVIDVLDARTWVGTDDGDEWNDAEVERAADALRPYLAADATTPPPH